MKNTLLSTVLLLTTSLSLPLIAAPAADGEHYGQRHERAMQRMSEQLSLSSEQQSQINQIHQQQAIRFKELREESQARIDAVLNDEQRQKRQQMQQQRRDHHTQQRQQGGRHHANHRHCDD